LRRKLPKKQVLLHSKFFNSLTKQFDRKIKSAKQLVTNIRKEKQVIAKKNGTYKKFEKMGTSGLVCQLSLKLTA
jgi:hypothetical protein